MASPSKEFKSRYDTAKKWRQAEEPYLKGVLEFCCPGREKDFDQRATPRAMEESEIFISLAEELATDLAGDLVTYFTPAEAKWAEYEVTQEIPQDQAEIVQQIVQDHEDKLFSLIAKSNYNDIAPQWGFEAATHGTTALWVDVAHISQPIHFQVVQPHELLIVPGHLGILDRFRESYVPANTLEALLGRQVDLSAPKIMAKMEKPDQMVKVCWGFWVDWSDPAQPQWLHEITVDGERVTDEKQWLGPLAGSCPLHVGRFNPQAGRPWARGPGRKALPDMRMLDKIDEIVLSGLDQSLLNTLIYADDGFIDFEKGIVAGTAIPAARGFTRDQVYELNRGVNLDQGWFTEERIEDRIRRAFYQDGPRQRGETPPTAAQWLDERRRVQQRLGKPSAPLWTEMIKPLIQRIDYLGSQLGELPGALTHNGQAINVAPISPLQKAQNQDKVMVARSNLELGVAAFGEAVSQIVDMPSTYQNIIDASGDELTKIAKQEPANAPIPPA